LTLPYGRGLYGHRIHATNNIKATAAITPPTERVGTGFGSDGEHGLAVTGGETAVAVEVAVGVGVAVLMTVDVTVQTAVALGVDVMVRVVVTVKLGGTVTLGVAVAV